MIAIITSPPPSPAARATDRRRRVRPSAPPPSSRRAAPAQPTRGRLRHAARAPGSRDASRSSDAGRAVARALGSGGASSPVARRWRAWIRAQRRQIRGSRDRAWAPRRARALERPERVRVRRYCSHRVGPRRCGLPSVHRLLASAAATRARARRNRASAGAGGFCASAAARLGRLGRPLTTASAALGIGTLDCVLAHLTTRVVGVEAGAIELAHSTARRARRREDRSSPGHANRLTALGHGDEPSRAQPSLGVLAGESGRAIAGAAVRAARCRPGACGRRPSVRSRRAWRGSP